jgi:RHS repeat-associated protein
LETNQTGIVQAEYTVEPEMYGKQLSQDRLGVSYFYLFDGVGSTDRLTGATGAVTDTYIYQAFGVQQVASGVSLNPFRYVGELGYYYDPDTGYLHLRSRTYVPWTGLFLSRDATSPSARAESSAYIYCNGNPVACVDPTGEDSWDVQLLKKPTQLDDGMVSYLYTNLFEQPKVPKGSTQVWTVTVDYMIGLLAGCPPIAPYLDRQCTLDVLEVGPPGTLTTDDDKTAIRGIKFCVFAEFEYQVVGFNPVINGKPRREDLGVNQPISCSRAQVLLREMVPPKHSLQHLYTYRNLCNCCHCRPSTITESITITGYTWPKPPKPVSATKTIPC